MSVKLLIEHHLEFLSLKGGCAGSSESTLVKMPHCWKSHVAAHFVLKMLYAAYIQVHFRIDFFMEANNMNPDQTVPKGAV